MAGPVVEGEPKKCCAADYRVGATSGCLEPLQFRIGVQPRRGWRRAGCVGETEKPRGCKGVVKKVKYGQMWPGECGGREGCTGNGASRCLSAISRWPR